MNKKKSISSCIAKPVECFFFFLNITKATEKHWKKVNTSINSLGQPSLTTAQKPFDLGFLLPKQSIFCGSTSSEQRKQERRKNTVREIQQSKLGRLVSSCQMDNSIEFIFNTPHCLFRQKYTLMTLRSLMKNIFSMQRFASRIYKVIC